MSANVHDISLTIQQEHDPKWATIYYSLSDVLQISIDIRY
jgi:hypothetical protein